MKNKSLKDNVACCGKGTESYELVGGTGSDVMTRHVLLHFVKEMSGTN